MTSTKNDMRNLRDELTRAARERAEADRAAREAHKVRKNKGGRPPGPSTRDGGDVLEHLTGLQTLDRKRYTDLLILLLGSEYTKAQLESFTVKELGESGVPTWLLGSMRTLTAEGAAEAASVIELRQLGKCMHSRAKEIAQVLESRRTRKARREELARNNTAALKQQNLNDIDRLLNEQNWSGIPVAKRPKPRRPRR